MRYVIRCSLELEQNLSIRGWMLLFFTCLSQRSQCLLRCYTVRGVTQIFLQSLVEYFGLW